MEGRISKDKKHDRSYYRYMHRIELQETPSVKDHVVDTDNEPLSQRREVAIEKRWGIMISKVFLVLSFVTNVWASKAVAQQAQSASQVAPAASDSSSVATSLTNPISSLISVPFQSNFDYHVGPDHDGFRYTLNFQPVIPVKLTDQVNLISRTILPVINQTNASVERTSESGLGDTIQSFFFSPSRTKPFIWGVGPVLSVPTATNRALGSRKLSIGPTVVALKQDGGFIVGALFFHVWSVAGSASHPNVSLSFLQPFAAYTTKKAWTFLLNSESSYDGHAWSVPINFQITKLLKLGPQRVQVGGGLRCWATSAAEGPRDCGFRTLITLVYPTKQGSDQTQGVISTSKERYDGIDPN